MNSIVEAVFNYAEKNPEKIAIIDSNSKLSFDALKDSIVIVSHYFLKKGIRSGNIVFVECTQDSLFLICALACHFLHCIFVPLEKNIQFDRFIDILKIVEPNYIIADKLDFTDKEKTIFCKEMKDILQINNSVSWAGKIECEREEREEIEEILFSTGTTGIPKGIIITNKNNIAIAENIICGTEMKQNNVELIPLPLSHSHGLRTCYANLYNGSTVVIKDGIIDVSNIFRSLKEDGITALDLSPSAAKILLNLTKEHLKEFDKQIDYVELGTEVLEQGIKDRLKYIFPYSRLYNFYGSTESGRSCVLNFNSMNDVEFSIGFPSKNSEFIVVDEDKNIIDSASDSIGCLAVKGPMNTIGYWNDKKLSNETIKNGYIFTNDIGYIDKNDMIFVLGRSDDVINYKGIKISPEEIESIVMNYHKVKDCACVPKDDVICGQVPILFIQPMKDFFVEDLQRYLREKISIERIPQKIYIVDNIPRTSDGKKNRKQLRETIHEK